MLSCHALAVSFLEARPAGISFWEIPTAQTSRLRSSPTSSNPLEKLLPGNDPAQSVAGASVPVIHSLIDILSFRGHAAQTLTVCGLWELPKHICNTLPRGNPLPLPGTHSHCLTNRKLHIHAQKAWVQREGSKEPRGRRANASVRPCDPSTANGREAVGVLPTLLSWIQCPCKGLSTYPCSGGKYKYHWNAYELSKRSSSGWCGEWDGFPNCGF